MPAKSHVHTQSTRKLAAIMFTDIVGYTALMQQNEESAVSMVDRHQEVLEKVVKRFSGSVFQYYGDGSLSIFGSATEAVQAAMEIQQQLKKKPKVPLRIGIHIGEIRIEGEKIFGDGVNLASRIESIGQAGSVLFSDNVYQKIRNNPAFKSESLGTFNFKNVATPMEVFAVANDGFPVPARESISGKLAPTAKPGKAVSLKKVGITGSLAILILLLAFWVFGRKAGFLRQDDLSTASIANSIAVLPFDNYNVMAEQEFFAEGIADEIRSQLLSISDLKVISSSSSKYYKGKSMSLKKIGRELDVNYVLEGTVQHSANMVKVGVQLSNTRSDKLEWSPVPFERKMDDVFLLQNEIAQQVAGQLKLKLSEREKNQLDKIPTRNAEAYISYQKGQELLKRGGGRIEELDEAKRLFEEAIRLDHKFHLAYIGLSDANLEHVFWGRSAAAEVLPEALNAAFKALELDDENGEIYGALGAINYYRYERETAKKYLEKAIELSPNYLPGYEWLAWIKVYEGDSAEAMKLFKKAQELDPMSTKYFGEMGYAYFFLKQYQKGLEIIESSLMKHPDDNFLLWILGVLHCGRGDYSEAIRTFHRRSAGTRTNWMLGYAFGMNGQREKAEEILNYQLVRRSEEHVPAFFIATVYMGMNEKEKTIEWLEKDYEEGGQGMMFWGLKTDERFDPVRDDPRFLDLLNKIH